MERLPYYYKSQIVDQHPIKHKIGNKIIEVSIKDNRMIFKCK